ncbi:MAG: alcohol dehydrogenase catalytic domain-containing protein [Actinobacteria bacterium]|nr:alcohol dehydrogenase catalytic domain-containing protein [Actinomycetota bacterium]
MRSRGAVLKAFGAPLQVESFEAPDPEPGALLVKVAYGGVCGTDVHLQAGHLPMPTPVILGHEAVGTVAALGGEVPEDVLGAPLKEGDRVTWASSIACGRCFYCRQEHQPTLCQNRRVYGISRRSDKWPHLLGSWGDLQYLEAGSTVVRLPDEVSMEAAIALGCAGPTVVHGVLGIAKPTVGDTVVVQGCGPVGLAAAMFARLSGAGRILMLGGPSGRVELARELGVADVYIDIFEVTDPGKRTALVMGHTPGSRGADIVVEATGVPSAVAEGLEMCRPNGTYLVLGQYTDHGPTPLNPHLITRKQLRVLGSWALSGADVVDFVVSLPQLSERFDLARLVTPYPLEAVNEALDDVREGRVTKAVLAPAQ